MPKHEIFVLSGSAHEPHGDRPSKLDRFLADLRRMGRRIVDYRRMGDRWVVKLMAVR